ncbi:MAG: ATP-binding protein [Rhizobiaceae bacterium]
MADAATTMDEVSTKDGEHANERVPVRDSIRYRISTAFGLIMIMAFILAAGVLSVRSYLSDVQASSERLRGIASILAATVANDFAARDRQGVTQSLTAIRELNEIAFVAIEDNDGRRFADIGTATFLSTERQEISRASALDLLTRNSIWVQAEIRKSGERLGWIYLLSDITHIRVAAMVGLAINSGIALVATLIAFFAASRVVVRMTRPLSKLSYLMRSLSKNAHFSVRADESVKGEIGLLAHSFNTMISRIENRDQQLRDYRYNLEQKVETRTHQLQAAKDEAEAANKAKSDFLATMSHEIRTPMNGMLVMAQLLSSAPLPDQYRRYANVISRSGQGLLTIINDILDISKIEAGKLELEKISFSPDEVVSGVVSLFWERAREKELDLAFHVAADVPRSVEGDQTRVTQVITNLVNNALKFTETGGVIIQMSVVEGAVAGHCRLRCAVRDTGVGIPEEKLASVFERFTQADQSTTRKYGGTGLGLSISQRLIEAMDGQIGVSSKLRKGSTFWFEVNLPVVQEARRMHNALVQKRKVAVATRGVLTAGCLANALEENGFEVATNANGALPDPRTVDALLCDPTMLHGLPLGYDAVPAIGLAGLADQSIETGLREGWLQDVLHLPFVRSDLRQMSERIRVNEYRGTAALGRSEQSAPQHAEFTGVRVLAVDDNLINREVLRDTLNTLKADVTLAESGEMAIDLIAIKQFDMVFMDCSMPGMDGFETTRIIRRMEADEGRSELPVVALTAHVSGEETLKWRESGMNGYLTKPFTIEQIVQAIRDHAGQSQAPAAMVQEPVEHSDVREEVALDRDESVWLSTGDFEEAEPLDETREESAGEQFHHDQYVSHPEHMEEQNTLEIASDGDEISLAETGNTPVVDLIEADRRLDTSPEFTPEATPEVAPEMAPELELEAAPDAAPEFVRGEWRESELISEQTLTLLDSLSASGGVNMASKIFGLFLLHAEPAIVDLKNLLRNEPEKSAAKDAHALKSMSLSAGASVMAGILQRIEDYAKKGEPSKGEALLGELDMAFQRTAEAMSTRINDASKETGSTMADAASLA